MSNPLSCVQFPPAPPKPRTRGMTIVSDPGESLAMVSPSAADEVVEVLAPFIDAVKIRHFMSATFPREWVEAKIRSYTRRGIDVYPGGIVSEAAALQNGLEPFYQASRALGFTMVELSENIFPVESPKRAAWISQARSYGLEVVYEYGRKYPDTLLEVDRAVDEIKSLFHAGARYVVLERAEIDVLKTEAPDRFVEIVQRVGLDRFILEMGPNKFPEYPLWFIELFGPGVNMANVKPHEITRIHEYRIGLDRQVGYEFIAEGARAE